MVRAIHAQPPERGRHVSRRVQSGERASRRREFAPDQMSIGRGNEVERLERQDVGQCLIEHMRCEGLGG